jgi:hypothetical protein
MHHLRQRHCPINPPRHCKKQVDYRVVRHQTALAPDRFAKFWRD